MTVGSKPVPSLFKLALSLVSHFSFSYHLCFGLPLSDTPSPAKFCIWTASVCSAFFVFFVVFLFLSLSFTHTLMYRNSFFTLMFCAFWSFGYKVSSALLFLFNSFMLCKFLLQIFGTVKLHHCFSILKGFAFLPFLPHSYLFIFFPDSLRMYLCFSPSLLSPPVFGGCAPPPWGQPDTNQRAGSDADRRGHTWWAH